MPNMQNFEGVMYINCFYGVYNYSNLLLKTLIEPKINLHIMIIIVWFK